MGGVVWCCVVLRGVAWCCGLCGVVCCVVFPLLVPICVALGGVMLRCVVLWVAWCCVVLGGVVGCVLGGCVALCAAASYQSCVAGASCNLEVSPATPNEPSKGSATFFAVCFWLGALKRGKALASSWWTWCPGKLLRKGTWMFPHADTYDPGQRMCLEALGGEGCPSQATASGRRGQLLWALGCFALEVLCWV